MERKFETCPHCEGEGWAPKCLCCSGFGLVDRDDMIRFALTQTVATTQVTFDDDQPTY